ncbi:MAG: hypothetical protein LIP04_12530 [Tannerellaceae bacterium]|nr:hypothetical protein [Tannerellaceae bacterium]
MYDFPCKLDIEGAEAMRETYSSLFRNIPGLHGEVLSETVFGNQVMMRERVTGFDDGYILDAACVYVIKEDKIAEVYFF